MEDDNLEKERYRENHCEIERRRRCKMSSYITELSSMVPLCSNQTRKLDKLTILRLANEHLKNVRGMNRTITSDKYNPAFLSNQELKRLILQAADGFLFVVKCEDARIMYVSQTITDVLNEKQENWLNSCIFNHLHPDDIAKFRDQLSTLEPSNCGRILDLKTGILKIKNANQSSKRGAQNRRVFICRMKMGIWYPQFTAGVNRTRDRSTLGPSQNGEDYAVVRCSGYFESWPPQNPTSCFIVMGRLQVASKPDTSDLLGSKSDSEFISRHSINGSFTFVDQRVIPLLGYAPRELLGQSCFDFFHPEDKSHIEKCFEEVVKMKGQVVSMVHRFRSKNFQWISFRANAFAFLNPYSEEIEFIVCTHTIISKVTQPQPTTTVNQTTSQIVYQTTRGSDYNLFNETRNDMYSSQCFIGDNHSSTRISPNLPSFNQNQSPVGYLFPVQRPEQVPFRNMPRNSEQIPTQPLWDFGQHTSVTDDYQYQNPGAIDLWNWPNQSNVFKNHTTSPNNHSVIDPIHQDLSDVVLSLYD